MFDLALLALLVVVLPKVQWAPRLFALLLRQLTRVVGRVVTEHSPEEDFLTAGLLREICAAAEVDPRIRDAVVPLYEISSDRDGGLVRHLFARGYGNWQEVVFQTNSPRLAKEMFERLGPSDTWKVATQIVKQKRPPFLIQDAIAALELFFQERTVVEQFEAVDALASLLRDREMAPFHLLASSVLLPVIPVQEQVEQALSLVFHSSLVAGRDPLAEQLALALVRAVRCNSLSRQDLGEFYSKLDRARFQKRGVPYTKSVFSELGWGRDLIHYCGREEPTTRFTNILANELLLNLPLECLQVRRAFFEANSLNSFDAARALLSQSALQRLAEP